MSARCMPARTQLPLACLVATLLAHAPLAFTLLHVRTGLEGARAPVDNAADRDGAEDGPSGLQQEEVMGGHPPGVCCVVV